MATFIWIGTGTASLGDPANWTNLTDGTPGVPGAGDTAIMDNSSGAYDVTVLAQTHAVDAIIFATNGTANEATFTIGDGTAPASLTTNTLEFDQSGLGETAFTINALGVFDVTTTLTNNT